MAESEHDLIDTLADEFLERLQRDETPSISEYCLLYTSPSPRD